MKRKFGWVISLAIIALTVFLADININITHATKGTTTHIVIYNIVGIALIISLLLIALRRRK